MMKIALLSVVFIFAGCIDIDTPDNKNALGGTILVDIDGASVKKSLIEANMPGVDEGTTVYGYRAYKIPYTTTNEAGQSVSASGLMVVPTGMPDIVYQIGLSLVSDDHGTIMRDDEAPTVSAQISNSPDGSAIIMTSLAGFVTLQPDYIGFGDSREQYHPFVLPKSLARSTIDFIHASKAFAEQNNIKLNGQLFLTGYSEGGYASMATLKTIEEEARLKVTMATPMAGPYDMNRTAFGVLGQANLSIPSFMANVGYSYAKAYNQPLDSVFNEPYASTVEELLSGAYTRVEVDAELTTTTTGNFGLFTMAFVQNFFTNDKQWFREAMVANNLHNWKPKTAVRLIHCEGDDVIPYGISELTVNTMQSLGAKNIALIPVEATLGLPRKVGHAECGLYAYGLSAQLFAEVRRNTMRY
jgi:hypothetical protein